MEFVAGFDYDYYQRYRKELRNIWRRVQTKLKFHPNSDYLTVETKLDRENGWIKVELPIKVGDSKAAPVAYLVMHDEAAVWFLTQHPDNREEWLENFYEGWREECDKFIMSVKYEDD